MSSFIILHATTTRAAARDPTPRFIMPRTMLTRIHYNASYNTHTYTNTHSTHTYSTHIAHIYTTYNNTMHILLLLYSMYIEHTI